MKDRKHLTIVVCLIILVIGVTFFLYTHYFSTPTKSVTSTSYLQSVFTSMFGVVSDNTVIMPSWSLQPTVPPVSNNLVGVDGFAQCLSGKGLKMYGTPTCPSCAEQKRLFGSSFRYITYIDCESQKETCQQKNIRGYPTWEFGDGRMVSGIIPLSYFAEQTGCTLN